MSIANEIQKLTNPDTFWDDVRKLVGFDEGKFWEDWQIKMFQSVADARYEEIKNE